MLCTDPDTQFGLQMVDYPVEVSQSGLTSSDNAQRCTTVTSSSGAEFTNMPDSVGGPGGGPPGVHLPPPHRASAAPLHGTPSGLELTPLSKNLHRPAYDPQRGYPQVLGGPGPQPPTGVARIASSRINQSASITTWGFGRESRYNASELLAEPTTTFTAGTCWSDYRECVLPSALFSLTLPCCFCCWHHSEAAAFHFCEMMTCLKPHYSRPRVW